ncbi:protein DOUBLE-STRAND BREAK FORMATION-like isoform X2 [Silene latifolia]|uniref:protein DOUBLE-STRAND BREAK FORMATION-like isoform X2 n=1 Tax=Silene latifolia TaxID=37657 RepID=UPI003D76FC43
MADALPLFSSRLKSNRLDESTLEILEQMLSSSKNVKEMQHLRTHLLQFLTSQSVTIIRHSVHKPILHRLSTLDFFLRAFLILHDLQSCLSLRYEGLVLRDSSAATHPHFQVTYGEWMKFAEDAFQNAFYSVAAKACENAISCFDRNGDQGHDKLPEKTRSIDRIHRLKDAALQLSSNHSAY